MSGAKGSFGEDVFTNEFDAIEMVETYETRDNETASRLVEFSRLVPFDELDYVPTGSPQDVDSSNEHFTWGSK